MKPSYPADPIERLEVFLTNREAVQRDTGFTAGADDYASQLKALKALRAEVARLREDKERLDLIEELKADLFESHNKWYLGLVEIESETAAPTARAAIDKARAAIRTMEKNG